jgi:hypothetical protein
MAERCWSLVYGGSCLNLAGDAAAGPHAGAQPPVEAPQGPRPLYSGPGASTTVGCRRGRTRQIETPPDGAAR